MHELVGAAVHVILLYIIHTTIRGITVTKRSLSFSIKTKEIIVSDMTAAVVS